MVKICKLKLTRLQEDILRFLFIKAGKSFNARNIARALEVSQPAISKALPLLKKEGFIKVYKDKESKRLSIELNRDNQKIMVLKRAENLKMLYQSDLVQFLEDKFPGTTIILFGSYSRGDDDATSDIDIAIIGSKEKETNLKSYEEKLGRKIILNFYQSLKGMHNELKENLCNGIILTGGIRL